MHKCNYAAFIVSPLLYLNILPLAYYLDPDKRLANINDLFIKYIEVNPTNDRSFIQLNIALGRNT